MGDSLEDLLAQLKAKYQDDTSSGDNPPDADTPSTTTPSPATSQSSFPQRPQSAPLPQPDSIDALLSQIEGKSTFQGANLPQTPPISSPHSFPDSSSVHQSNWQQIEDLTNPISNQKLPNFPSKAQTSSSDALLNDLKQQYQEQDRVEQLQRQEQQRAEQLRQEKLKREKQAQALKQAEAWLKDLDPRSGEAAWFEEFASKYESRVDAAIDYLGLLTES